MHRGWAALVFLTFSACTSTTPPRIVRVTGGQAREGAFISPFAYEHFVRGELALTRGDPARAVTHFRMARTGPADDPLVIARLSTALNRAGDAAEAAEVLDDALARMPRAEALWLAKGQLAEARGRSELAIESYERAAQVAPRSDRGPLALARLLRSRGAAARAERVLRTYEARVDEPSAGASRARLEIALARRDARAAAAAVEDLLEVAPARIDEVRRVATLAVAERRHALAARILERMPSRAGPPRLRVEALLGAGRQTEAEALLATHPPEAFGGLGGQAALYLEAERPERAAELAEAAVVAHDSPRARLVAGQARLALGHWGKAAAQLADVPAETRGYAEARIALARALVAQALPGLASEVLHRARERTANARGTDADPALGQALAEARLARGDPAAALAALPADGPPPIQAARAELLERLGELDAAIELYRQLAQAAAALPDAARARVRAEAAAASDDARRAATLLAPIAEAHPGNLNARVRLAELWSAAGAHERARDIARSLVPLTAGALKRRVRSVLERVGRGQGSQPASPRSKRPPEHRRRDRPRRRASAR